jgi:hypothetical protein
MDYAQAKTRMWVRMPKASVGPGTGRYWTHPFPPLAPMVPLGGCEPVGGPTFETLGLKWVVRTFSALYPLLAVGALLASLPLGVSFKGIGHGRRARASRED